MISPDPDRVDQIQSPANPMTTPTLQELYRLGCLIEQHAIAAKREGASASVDFLDPIVCRLETAAGLIRGLGS
jgi:hypothetical protein